MEVSSHSCDRHGDRKNLINLTHLSVNVINELAGKGDKRTSVFTARPVAERIYFVSVTCV